MPSTTALSRSINVGSNTVEVLNILRREIGNEEAIQTILTKATQIVEKSVDPTAGPPEQPNDGLLYGLIQSGKTSIITVTAALAADNGFNCILILTSDIDLLYDQTLERARNVLRGLSVLGKNDWRDSVRFERQLRTTPFVIVCSKNGSKLGSLLNAFQTAGARELSTFIIDDEADQASLNTLASKQTSDVSRINDVIISFRNYFPVNTYLQVTATPQALFLQRPDHRFRPSFTVLSSPGKGYVGGEAFFGSHSNLIEYVDLQEINQLRTSNQPTVSDTVPTGLRRALLTFLVGSTIKILKGEDNNYAFLCHVSVNKRDHEHIVNLVDRFKEDTLVRLSNTTVTSHVNLINEFKQAYLSLSNTENSVPAFDKVIEKIKFYLRGAIVRLINASSTEEIKLDAAYNIFVGGNKLGRGVTIKNLLVSYYGRNPQRPNSDTVLQHARMYGYRQKTLGVTRLFLPERLADHFRLIHQMEDALRSLVEKHPDGKFEGLYISTPLQATRKNVLDPNSIGLYVGGGYCNPAYPLRTSETRNNTSELDGLLSDFSGESEYYEISTELVTRLILLCRNDPEYGAEMWNHKTLIAAIEALNTLYGNRAYIRVKRNRNLNERRRETQGFLSGGEESLVPDNAISLFMYRLDKRNQRDYEIWWPMIRFPEGSYVLAFSFNR